MLRACTKLTSVARRLTCGECAEHISPTSRVALHLLLTTAAAGRAADGYRRGRCSSDHNGESGGKYRENAWYYSSASESATPSSMTAALIAAVLAGMGVFSTGSIVLQEQGPVPGGPILEGDEDDAFQRFPASSRVHHAIKVSQEKQFPRCSALVNLHVSCNRGLRQFQWECTVVVDVEGRHRRPHSVPSQPRAQA